MSHGHNDHDLNDEQIEARRLEAEKRIEEAHARIVEVGLIRNQPMIDDQEPDLWPGNEILVAPVEDNGVFWVGAMAKHHIVKIIETDLSTPDALKDLIGNVVKTATERRKERLRAQGEKPKPEIITLPLPQGITLVNARLSQKDDDSAVMGFVGEIAGHWDLRGYKILGGVEDWSFGQEPTSEIDPDRVYPLLSLLADGRVCVPRIPTFKEACEWIRDQKIATPGMVCGCGQVHSGPGTAVAMTSHHHAPLSGRTGHNSVNLTVVHDDGSPGHAHPTGVLCLRDCLLLKAVEAPDTAEVKADAEERGTKLAGVRERKKARLARKFGAQGSQGVADDDVN